MTISFVAATSVEASSVSSMPSHQKGDLLVMFAFRAANSIATTPTGWAAIVGVTSTTRGLSLAYRIAGSSSETSGTWANASMLTCAVFRDDANIIVIGGVSNTGNTTTNVSYQALAVKSTVNSTAKLIGDSSVLVLYGGALTNNSTMEQTPAGCTTQHNAVLATYEAVIHTTNAAVASRATTGITADIAVTTSTYTVELYDTGVAKTSAASFRPVNIRGGADQ
jgi:hypothetical protein